MTAPHPEPTAEQIEQASAGQLTEIATLVLAQMEAARRSKQAVRLTPSDLRALVTIPGLAAAMAAARTWALEDFCHAPPPDLSAALAASRTIPEEDHHAR